MAEPRSDRTRVRRLPDRAAYDRGTMNAILDEGFVCHVAFVENGQPFVIPTGYARDGDRILIHGSAASRMLRILSAGAPLCLTVTLVDGLVLARSAFHHSMNYRSVVVLGKAKVVEERGAKMKAMRLLMDHIVPGRWSDCRPPSDEELKATTVLEIPLEEASAKIRSGPPKDDAEDMELGHWAGVLPIVAVPQRPLPDPGMPAGIGVPDYVTRYTRSRG